MATCCTGRLPAQRESTHSQESASPAGPASLGELSTTLHLEGSGPLRPLAQELRAGCTSLPYTCRQDHTCMIRMCESRFYWDNKNLNDQKESEPIQRRSVGGKESEGFLF